MSTSHERSTAEDLARYRQGVRVFQAHAAAAAGTLVLILAVNLLTSLSSGTAGNISAWWSLWAILGWSSGLGVHGFVVWLARPVTEIDNGTAAG